MQALPAQESSLPSLQQALDAYEAVEFGNAHLGASRSRLHEAFRKEQARVCNWVAVMLGGGVRKHATKRKPGGMLLSCIRAHIVSYQS